MFLRWTKRLAVATTLCAGGVFAFDRTLRKTPLNHIPTNPDGTLILDPKWLSNIFQKPVNPIQSEPIQGGLSGPTLTRVTTDSPDLPSFVVKFLSLGEHELPLELRIGQLLASPEHMLKKELYFYEELYKDVEPLGVRVPKIYHSEFEDHGERARFLRPFDFKTKGKSLVLMEDLSHCAHHKINDGARLSEEEAREALSAIARLHAGFWGRSPGGFVPFILYMMSLPFSFQKYVIPLCLSEEKIEKVQETWKDAPNIGPVLSNQKNQDTLHVILRKSKKILGKKDPRAFQQKTLTHGDFHQGNLFFDGKEVILIDWQLYGEASPIEEITYFMNTSVKPDLEADKRLLRFYYDELIKNGVDSKKYEFELFQQECDQRWVQNAMSYSFNYFMETPQHRDAKHYKQREMEELTDLFYAPAIERASFVIDRYGPELDIPILKDK